MLASASPRRLALLAQIGLDPHYVHATDVDETPKLREHPATLAKRLAKEKRLRREKLYCGVAKIIKEIYQRKKQ